MARKTRRAALQETFALPQTEGIVGEAPGAAVRPIRRICLCGQPVVEHGQEIVVIVSAGNEAIHPDIAEGVALRADHGAARGIELRRQDELRRRRARTDAVMRYMLARRTMAALAV